MRAVQISRFGGPEVLQVVDVAAPVAGPGEVVIEVRTVEVLFIDTQLRSGWGKDYFPMRPPWIPGTGVAGVIASVGENVDAERVGEVVVARTGDDGAYAEQVSVEDIEAFVVPPGLDPGSALAALHDGPLALDRLDYAAVREGSRVLVTAAAGGAGHWFVPLAKAAGAEVVGAAGGERKLAAVTGLGADEVVDYRQDGWADRAGGPFDVVFDGAGGDIGRTAFEQTGDGGLFFGHGAASGGFGATSSERGIEVVGVDRRFDATTWRELTERALTVLARGDVRPTISPRVPLERAAEAHLALAERSVIGKTVLVV